MKYLFLLIFSFCINAYVHSQGEPPWRRPLKICQSTDGNSFSNISTFQDSSGVPCIIKLPNGNLISAFQWFRQPVGSVTWDRVAVKFSGDNGITWTQPQPIIVNGFPVNYQRPFDPALAVTDSGKIRIYYSSGLNAMLDTSINTYSAISDDGVNYQFEGNIRFSLPDRPVIDPAIIKFNNLWHLVNPATMGLTGAYHNISNNGLDFMRVPDIMSDMSHSWIGNFLIKDTNELRFYGSGMNIWYSASPNGGVWSSFTNTNITGGDPAVVKISSDNYLMIYTGPPYPVSITENTRLVNDFILYQNYPNPFNPVTKINYKLKIPNYISLKVYDPLGQEVAELVNGIQEAGIYDIEWNASDYPSGIYFYKLVVRGANPQKNGELSDVKRMILIK